MGDRGLTGWRAVAFWLSLLPLSVAVAVLPIAPTLIGIALWILLLLVILRPPGSPLDRSETAPDAGRDRDKRT